MDEQMIAQLTASAQQLAAAAEALEHAAARLDAEREALEAKVERIVATVEERLPAAAKPEGGGSEAQKRIAELERANAELKAEVARGARKTLPPLVSALLAKNSVDTGAAIDAAVLEKALAPLSLDQRIAVKAELARAGLIE